MDELPLPPPSEMRTTRDEFESYVLRMPDAPELTMWITARAQRELAPTSPPPVRLAYGWVGFPEGYALTTTSGVLDFTTLGWGADEHHIGIIAGGHDSALAVVDITNGEWVIPRVSDLRGGIGETYSRFPIRLTRRSQYQLVGLLASIWKLMDSPRTVHHREIASARRSRSGCSGARQTLATVDVRPIEEDSAPTIVGHSGFRREHDHRWSVRGHFRNQAYGPGRSLRRRVWIADHVAGPADKPLRERTGPTVHVVRGG